MDEGYAADRLTACEMLTNGLYTTGHTATVFGATGALGRYIVNRLGMLPPTLVSSGLLETNMLKGPT